MKTANRTDIGRIRLVNEDRAAVLPEINGYTIAIVADGMGGHQAGDTASQMAIETIAEQLQELPAGIPVEEIEQAVRRAIEQANENIHRYASEREQFHGMGTTVVVTVATIDTLVIGHIGDSRAYLISSDSIEQLTEDHSLVNELVRSGQITKEEADHHPRRNVLTRALGTDPRVEADLYRCSWKTGDIVLICSDGLSSLVDSRLLFDILRADHDLDGKVNHLIEQALEAGGDDNITVVLIENEPKLREEEG